VAGSNGSVIALAHSTGDGASWLDASSCSLTVTPTSVLQATRNSNAALVAAGA